MASREPVSPSPSTSALNPSAAGAPWFRRLTLHGLLASVCPLIPLPFLDDWALAWVNRRLAAETLRTWGIEPLPWQLETLGWDGLEDHRSGCVRALSTFVLLGFYVVKRLFRKLLVILTLKDCVDAFSRTFHEGYLLHRAFERGILDGPALTGGNRLLAVRQAILDTCRAIDPRPVNQLVKRSLRGSRRLLFGTSRRLGRKLRQEKEKAGDGAAASLAGEEGSLGGLADTLAAELWGDAGYRESLDRRFDRALASRRIDEAARFHS